MRGGRWINAEVAGSTLGSDMAKPLIVRENRAFAMAVPSRGKVRPAFEWPGFVGRKRRAAGGFFSQIATAAETTNNPVATLRALMLRNRIFRLGG
jgi:hypothetical protein